MYEDEFEAQEEANRLNAVPGRLYTAEVRPLEDASNGRLVFAVVDVNSEGSWTVTLDGSEIRLANANAYFQRKASEVWTDVGAIGMLELLYEKAAIDISEYDLSIGVRAVALAKLTAANYAEVGAMVIYVTEAGQRAIEAFDEMIEREYNAKQ